MTACGSGKNLNNTSVIEINFGNGGGFTGEVKTYTLKISGELLENNIEINQLSKKQVNNLFKSAENLKDYKFREPNNTYSFIEIKLKDSSNYIVWNIGTKNINEDVLKLYNNLMSLTLKTNKK